MSNDLDWAIYNTVHDFKGGARALSAHVAVRAGTLNNKADPGCDTHHLTYHEGIAIQLATQDFRIISTEAAILGGSFIRLAPLEFVSDMALLDAWARWHEETGETAAEVRKALSDGQITRAEYNRIRIEVRQDIQREMEFLRRLEALVIDDD